MKIRVMAALAALVGVWALQAGAAQAADGFYVGSSVGAHVGNDFDKAEVWIQSRSGMERGYSFGLAAGYHWSDFRFEAEGTYGLLAKVKGGSVPPTVLVTPGFRTNGDVTMWTAMLGAYYDFPVTRTYQPYVGLGAGIADIDSEPGFLLIDEGINPAGFLEAGLNMAVIDGLTLAPAYRYTWVRSGNDAYDNVATHIVKLNARARF